MYQPVLLFLLLLSLSACKNNKLTKDSLQGSAKTSGYRSDSLPQPFATKSAQNFSKVIGWKNQETPQAPPGFTVTKFADGLNNPRWIYVAPNGDIFIAESNTILTGIKKIGAKLSRKISTQNYGESANRITLFRDSDQNGIPESKSVFLEKLQQPLGMMILDDHFYVANTDGIVMYPYKSGITTLTTTGRTIITLPAGGYNNHWTRNIIKNANGSKIYVSVGSGSNHAEHGMETEMRRANILEFNPDGSGERVFASGLRNPVGMDWATGTSTLWTAVNERDELGDELVPDYVTAVREGGFYGWPYSYWGQHEDPRMKEHQRPDLVKTAIIPDISLGAHTASLGLKFYNYKSFPAKYRGGAFVTQHGSWNRSALSGYKVVFIPFVNGKPAGKPEDFLTGFIKNIESSEVHGRPVGIAFLADGSMLVSDDASNTIWRIAISQ